MDYARDGSRKAKRSVTINKTSILEVFDERLMILSCYMCHSWCTPFLTRTTRWFVSLNKAKDTIKDYIVFPSNWILDRALKWPPDGIILRIVLFFLMILANLVIFIRCIHGSLSLIQFTYLQTPNYCTKDNSKKIVRSMFDQTFKYLYLATKYFSSKITYKVFSTIYAFSNDTVDALKSISWDSDSTSAVLDNSANIHIWSNLHDFVEGSLQYFDENSKIGVLTIGEDSSHPIATGTVIVGITDNSGSIIEVTLTKCLYFSTSPVNIISVTALTGQFNDENGTWIKTFWRRSKFS